jgi:hypothetical protein
MTWLTNTVITPAPPLAGPPDQAFSSAYTAAVGQDAQSVDNILGYMPPGAHALLTQKDGTYTYGEPQHWCSVACVLPERERENL